MFLLRVALPRNFSFTFNSFPLTAVRRVAKRFGMREVGEDDDWSLFWTDYSVALERCMEMKKYQVGLTSLHFVI